MSALTRPNLCPSRLTGAILMAVGVILLSGTWAVLYWSESLFTESHLVGYYCCVTEQDLPTRGTLERAASDFFRTSLGKNLPPLVFVAANVGLFVTSMRSTYGRGRWWLPYLYSALGILYLLTSFGLVGVSWQVSDGLVGPQTSAYKGYHRTWYGIVLHLMLWLGLFATLSGVFKKLRAQSLA